MCGWPFLNSIWLFPTIKAIAYFKNIEVDEIQTFNFIWVIRTFKYVLTESSRNEGGLKEKIPEFLKNFEFLKQLVRKLSISFL